ncbi:PREDICTED: phospholipase SGR2-like [Erythranthe guttata]|uniref:phospholipase SGR2-like n=1 Tax=Erythranthe guttata TaxID=4155 RepID=UPI00064E064F|nr:PREDICTED: phospholipase SGR2-like [Erythranthe guttata]|eukprot:XP_012838052.1 PREDICTED: phospholipase SGR2-like [Erythranthe guttata]
MALDMGGGGGDEAERISPEMLKNTPSNIRKLADEIEQFEGRQKYLARTRSPSDGGDVRWYFCKVPLSVNELAASVPKTEIVGKGDYFRFGMRDSLAIEASFLQREDELLSSWWKEYAECSDGPKGQPSITSRSSEQFSSVGPESYELFTTEEERVGVPVKGGLYEVDLVNRHCFPVYWNGENRRVLRGHWFARKGGLDWLPLREDVSEQLEYAYRSQVWHRRTFQPSGLFAARVDLQGSISLQGLHALFTGEDDTWEAWLSVDASGVYSVISLRRNGIKLRRGYASSQSQKPTQDEQRQQKEEEMDDYCSQVPVRHLVFMVHGIGQRLEKSNLVDDVGTFRHVTATVAERHLTSHQLGTQRVLYIPCQWRKGLTLSGEAAVEKITLDGVRGLRTMLSATVHDVLYYMSPIHCQDIIDSVNPYLIAFFFFFFVQINYGCLIVINLILVISFSPVVYFQIDLLKARIKEFEVEYADKVNARKSSPIVNQSDPESVQLGTRDSLKNYTPQIRYTKLEFKVDTFFAVGSPLGVFLSLRNVRLGIGKGKEYWEEDNINEEMPACRQMFNIFHPFDPVAYRIEPLVCKEYMHMRPVIIPYHRGGKRLYVGFQEFREGFASRSQAFVDHLSSVKVKVLTICESRSNDEQAEESGNTQERTERSYGSVMIERLTGTENGRIDHVLQDKTFRHPYLSAIGSHTNYWRDSDTALFILKHLYRDIPDEPISCNDQQLNDSSNDDKSLTTKWSDPREIADEELPLTFADSVSIRNFSQRAKKTMKS